MKPNRRARRKQADRRSLAVGVVVVTALLVMAAGALWLIGPATGPARIASIGGPFRLTEGDGRLVTDQDFRGKILLIYFGYTGCRDVCPTTLTGMAAALDALGDKARDVQPLFITLDPRRDTPAVVRRYAGSFTPKLIGLTGTSREIRRVEREYQITSVTDPDDTAGLDYAVDHSSVIYLIGRNGQFVAPIRADDRPAEMARSISRHL